MNRELYMGLFYAPHTVGEALKSAVYIAALYQSFGYDVTPSGMNPGRTLCSVLDLKTRTVWLHFARGAKR